MMSPKAILEICIDSVESAMAAERGGANRIELCSNLLEGGITPSAGLISTVRKEVSIGLQVMIRPRGGDFCYSTEEFEVMKLDIDVAKQVGADGIVLGILDIHGNVDQSRTRQLVDQARPLRVTFHRAFDMSSDLFKSLENIVSTGAERILTSGGQPSAEKALDVIAKLVQVASGRIQIMPCGDIRQDNIKHIIEATGAREIHAGIEIPVPSVMRHRNPRIAMGSVPGREFQRFVATEEGVRGLAQAL
jgi:copper homeostasis protein